MTDHPELFAALVRPFQPNEEKTKKGTGFKYVTARTVQNRLDEVLGPENWRAAFREVDRGVVCELWIRLPSGEWLSKQDAGGHSEMVQKQNGEVVDDDENAVKSGYSDALKRAAVAWGIGRYLYGDGFPRYAAEGAGAERLAGPRPLIERDNESEPPAARRPGRREARGHGAGAPARPEARDGADRWNGSKLFRWAKQQDEAAGDLGLVDWLSGWCKREHGSGKLMALSDDQAEQAHAAATRRLAELHGGNRPQQEAMAVAAPYLN